MLHDRFYLAWIQPTTNVAEDTRISTLVKVRIEKEVLRRLVNRCCLQSAVVTFSGQLALAIEKNPIDGSPKNVETSLAFQLPLKGTLGITPHERSSGIERS